MGNPLVVEARVMDARPGAGIVFACALACGPERIASEGGDELTVGETAVADTESDGENTESDGESTESETESTDTGSDDCPQPPEVIHCFSPSDCPDGFKCGGYFMEDCFGQPGGSMACVPVIGDRGLGQTCTTSSEQATPLFTWLLDDCNGEGRCLEHGPGAQEGTCVPYCGWEGVPPIGVCEDPQRICEGYVCVQQCDPTAIGDPCEGELVCGSRELSKPEFYCSTASFGAGEGLLGDECWNSFACENGLGCVSNELLPDCRHSRCCSPFCSLADTEPCAELGPAFSCVPFYEQGEAPPSLEHVGLCALL